MSVNNGQLRTVSIVVTAGEMLRSELNPPRNNDYSHSFRPPSSGQLLVPDLEPNQWKEQQISLRVTVYQPNKSSPTLNEDEIDKLVRTVLPDNNYREVDSNMVMRPIRKEIQKRGFTVQSSNEYSFPLKDLAGSLVDNTPVQKRLELQLPDRGDIELTVLQSREKTVRLYTRPVELSDALLTPLSTISRVANAGIRAAWSGGRELNYFVPQEKSFRFSQLTLEDYPVLRLHVNPEDGTCLPEFLVTDQQGLVVTLKNKDGCFEDPEFVELPSRCSIM